MRKIKIKKSFVNKKVIFISIIFSMSIMGVGYATWNDDTTINLSYKTGFIDPIFIIEDSIPPVENGDLTLKPSKDGNTLYIEGKVYPNFNENLLINITDNGTIPTIFNELTEDNGNVSELNIKKNINKNNNKKIESFMLNISPNNDEDLLQFNNSFSSSNDKSSSLEQEIEILREKINQYKEVRKYEFEYILNFEQGL
jgi:hypothetical protein